MIWKYVSSGIIISLLTICSFLYFNNKSLLKEIDLNKNRLANTESVLALQSKQIAQQAIEIEKYKNKEPKVVEVIKKVYEKVYVAKPTEECNVQLKSYNDLLDQFNKTSKEENYK